MIILTVGVGGPLEPYAAGFAGSLFDVGFTRLSAANQLRVFAHASRWLKHRGLSASDFTQERALAFLAARRRAGYTCWRSPRGIERILAYLRSLDIVPSAPKPEPQSTADRLLSAYAVYMANEQALAPGTIRGRTDVARRFLQEYGSTRLALRLVKPADVRAFLRRLSRQYAATSLAGVGSHLRSLFRFLHATGVICCLLSEAVPSSVGWRDSVVPTGISTADVQRLLRSCDRRTAVGRRDFVLIMLLARLGLRAREVLALQVGDIDWRCAEIVIHGKGSKRACLPLPGDVGRALSAYLLARPRVAERRVFLRHRAPHRPLGSIGSIVFAASVRAGLEPVRPHRLRRTAATQMLRRGASLAQIAQVLGHTVTQTTAIYAKVDRLSLRALAQAWPGVRA